MQRLKRVTQSVTTLLVVFCGLLVIPFAYSQLVEILGGWEMIDSLYRFSEMAFWSVFAVSRIFFAVMWFVTWFKAGEWGEKNGFLWFKPEKTRYHEEEEDRDKSGLIIFILLITIFGIVMAEFAIRLYTMTIPFYLPQKPQ